MRVLAILAMALLCSGCFVLDEFEQGEELMRQASSRGGKNLADEKAKAEQEAAWNAKPESGSGPSEILEGVGDTVSRWWDEATAEAPPEPGPGSELVRCTLDGKTRFMSRSDCEIRGGSGA